MTLETNNHKKGLETLEGIIKRLRKQNDLPSDSASDVGYVNKDTQNNFINIDGKPVRIVEDASGGFSIHYEDWQGKSEERRLSVWEDSLKKAGLLKYNRPLSDLEYKTVNRREVLSKVKQTFHQTRSGGDCCYTNYFYGPSGTGKTSLAVAIGHELVKDGWRVLAYRWKEFLINIIDAYSDDSKSVSGVQEEATKIPVLIIDEFSTRIEPTPSEKDTALGLISRREGMGLSTIITSNVSPNNLPYGQAVKSRIQSGYNTCFDEEKNYRLRK